MNGPQQPIDLVPQLVHDIVALIRLRPGALLRLPTSPCWGLALTRLGSALWVAISIAGCARIAALRRPWVHAHAPPDFGQLARLLAARFPHAEPREAPGSFLFALAESAGPYGRAVILAQASAERFPWMVAGSAQPLPPAAALDQHTEAQWRELCEVGALGVRAQDDLVSGGALPGADDPCQLFAVVLAGFDRALLLSVDGRSRARAALLLTCAHERQRLAMLRRAWPAPAAGNPYGEPSWLAPENAVQEIDQALNRLGQGSGAEVDQAGDAALPVAEVGASAGLRRPLVVPTIRAAVSLSAERQRTTDGRSGAG